MRYSDFYVKWYQRNVVFCALVGYYEAYGGNSLPTFRENLLVPSSTVKNSKKRGHISFLSRRKPEIPQRKGYLQKHNVTQCFVHWGTSKITPRVPRNPDMRRQKRNKAAVVGVRTLLQYCPLPDQSSRDAARDIWHFSRYCKMFVVFKLRISARPLMTFCQTLGLSGTLVGKYWHTFNIEKYYFWKPILALSYTKLFNSVAEETIKLKAKSQCTPWQLVWGCIDIATSVLNLGIRSTLEESTSSTWRPGRFLLAVRQHRYPLTWRKITLTYLFHGAESFLRS